MALLRSLFWIAVFLTSTLAFVVLFEHGTTDYAKHFTKRVEVIRKAAEEQIAAAQK